jgi:hypothetical protein
MKPRLPRRARLGAAIALLCGATSADMVPNRSG